MLQSKNIALLLRNNQITCWGNCKQSHWRPETGSCIWHFNTIDRYKTFTELIKQQQHPTSSPTFCTNLPWDRQCFLLFPLSPFKCILHTHYLLRLHFWRTFYHQLYVSNLFMSLVFYMHTSYSWTLPLLAVQKFTLITFTIDTRDPYVFPLQ